ncbi:MAG: chemotaxis protein CheW [Pseudomonadota bacterium]
MTAYTSSYNQTIELATFSVGDALYGLDILKVKEINKQVEMTLVPQSPKYVLGVINLRGRIVTVLDLGKKIGLSFAQISKKSRNIIVSAENEDVGLLVDRIDDIVLANHDQISPPPANIGGVQGRFFEGIFKTDKSLIAVLNLEEVLKK